MRNYFISILCFISFVGCKKEGCSDPTALNYNFNESIQHNEELCKYLDQVNNVTRTILCGEIELFTTWGKAPGATVDYYINCEININSQLTIDAGVVIEFGPNGKLIVNNSGRIISNGTVNNHVTFRGVNEEPWQGISFKGYSGTNVLNYTDIQNAYNSSRRVAIEVNTYGTLNLNNVLIEKSIGYGIEITNIKNTSQFDYLTIKDCYGSMLVLNILAVPVFSNISFLNNENFFEIPGANISNFILDVSLPYPIYFSGSGNVNYINSYNFTVSASNTIVLDQKYLRLPNSIDCNPISGNLIFTSKYSTGYWLGIQISMTNNPKFNKIEVNNVNLSDGSIRTFNYSLLSTVTLTNSNIACGPGTACGLYFTSTPNSSNYDLTGTTISCANQVCP